MLCALTNSLPFWRGWGRLLLFSLLSPHSSLLSQKNYQNLPQIFAIFGKTLYLCRQIIKNRRIMSYSQLAQLEFMNAVKSINSESELNEFRDLLARYFAQKAQKAIDALWDKGVINNETIEAWGEEHMRTPYQYEANRS